jgi:hypothetical protein
MVSEGIGRPAACGFAKRLGLPVMVRAALTLARSGERQNVKPRIDG